MTVRLLVRTWTLTCPMVSLNQLDMLNHLGQILPVMGISLMPFMSIKWLSIMNNAFGAFGLSFEALSWFVSARLRHVFGNVTGSGAEIETFRYI